MKPEWKPPPSRTKLPREQSRESALTAVIVLILLIAIVVASLILQR